MAFYQIEPFGFHATWAPFAHLLQMTYNMNLPKGKKRAKVEDFMPKEPGDEPTWQDMLKQAEMVTQMYGKKAHP